MNDGIFRLRISERIHQPEHAVEVEIRLGKLGRVFQAIIHEGIEIVEGEVVAGFKVHVWDCKSVLRIGKLVLSLSRYWEHSKRPENSHRLSVF